MVSDGDYRQISSGRVVGGINGGLLGLERRRRDNFWVFVD